MPGARVGGGVDSRCPVATTPMEVLAPAAADSELDAQAQQVAGLLASAAWVLVRRRRSVGAGVACCGSCSDLRKEPVGARKSVVALSCEFVEKPPGRAMIAA